MSLVPPLSLLRRGNGRLSIAGARSLVLSNPRNSILDAIPAKRPSLLSTPASKRRQSLMGTGSGTGSGTNLASDSRLDPRPLRDRNYQALLQHEIHDFLLANKFELESNHPLTTKTLRQPTQKDFVVIFQFLYNKLDPCYRFTRSIETEVFLLLKILNYPYLDTINRSQISAVGGQNWPAFLGVLYWLVKIILLSLGVNPDLYLTADDEFDKIYISYMRSAYLAYIDGVDDYSQQYAELEAKFHQLNDRTSQDIDRITAENSSLALRYSELQGQLSAVDNAVHKGRALESDLIKFKAYIEMMESRKSKWSDVLDKIRREIDTCDKERAQLETSKREIEASITERGFLISDIDRLNSERDKLSKQVDLVAARAQETANLVSTREIELTKHHESLSNLLVLYNAMVFRMPPTEHEFDIAVVPNILTSAEPLKPEQIVDKDLKAEKARLVEFRLNISTRIHQYQDELSRLQDQIDVLSETVREQTESADNLQAKLTASKATYKATYDSITAESMAYSEQIERLERDLRAMKINTNRGIIEAENRYQGVQMEYEEVKHSIKKDRKLLLDNVERIINSIIKFKLHFQLSLHELDLKTMEELEKEQAKQ
ncbi:hypothetical protein QFC19_005270 [Naganishia cerealis]|uniref:Uncharacterized protein n=1 Tax=Naganishia cerealis TaxID=610337 RepID=A0ACC2VQC2_9TREE|nr:hypothetical protein QFC19_005270 [Naganishia cerealis]